MSFLIASPCLQVKTAWLVDLENLVERISDKFSAHFASMGFAGQVSVYQEVLRSFVILQVVLHKGKFENDFENYGVDIMVKYRDREPLQRLTAHHQVQYNKIFRQRD